MNRSQTSLPMVGLGSKTLTAMDWDGEEGIARRLGKGDYGKSSHRAYHRCLMCWSFGLCLSRSAHETRLRSTLSAEAQVSGPALYPTRYLSQRPVRKRSYELSCCFRTACEQCPVRCLLCLSCLMCQRQTEGSSVQVRTSKHNPMA